MQILESSFFGKYYFEVALVLRSSLLLSSLLLNSEAWVNLIEKDIRALEQTDEILLTKILDCDYKTSHVFKYLELGIYPLRFELMKRSIIFLQYILKQDKNSMLYKVLKATLDNPLKNDFVQMCNKYLARLNINLSFEDIGKLSNYRLKKLVKQKTSTAAFSYLINEKNKQSKISNLNIKVWKFRNTYLKETKTLKHQKSFSKPGVKHLK